MRLLIADDDDYTREGLKESIDWAQYGIDDILLAGDGADASNKFDQKAGNRVNRYSDAQAKRYRVCREADREIAGQPIDFYKWPHGSGVFAKRH